MIALLLGMAVAGPGVVVQAETGPTLHLTGPAADLETGPTLALGAGPSFGRLDVLVRGTLGVFDGVRYYEASPIQLQGDSVLLGGGALVSMALVEHEALSFRVHGTGGLVAVPLLMDEAAYDLDVVSAAGGQRLQIHESPHLSGGAGLDLSISGPSGIGAGLLGEVLATQGVGLSLAGRVVLRYRPPAPPD